MRITNNLDNMNGYHYSRFAKKSEPPTTDTKISTPEDSEPLKTNDELKPGDKLKCISYVYNHLTLDKIYTIISLVGNDMVRIITDTGDSSEWFVKRFIKATPTIPNTGDIESQKTLPVKPQPKPLKTTEGLSVGDKITCLYNSGLMQPLTVGIDYTIRKISSHDNMVELQDDFGHLEMFNITRFAKVNVPAKKKAAYKPKYSKGDTFIATSGLTKYVILDVSLFKYKLQVYNGYNGYWKPEENSTLEGIKTFDKWIDDTVKAGTMLHDVQI
jgi:hypothetical protein